MATGHRSYQPVHPCGSKLLQKKWDQTYYDEHRRLVKSAKPMVDTQPPKKYVPITEEQKKKKLQKEREEEEERNQALFGKMVHIMHTTGGVEHRNPYYTEHRGHSLNFERRQRELERVAKENKAMLQRIQKVKPQYHVSDWIRDWQKKEELTEMITAFPSERPPKPKKPSRVSSESSPEETEDTSAPNEPLEEQEAPSPTQEATSPTHEARQPSAQLNLSRTTPNLAREISKAPSRRQNLSRTTPNLAHEISKASAPQKDRQSSASETRQSSSRQKFSVTVPNLEQEIKRASLQEKVKQRDVRRSFA